MWFRSRFPFRLAAGMLLVSSLASAQNNAAPQTKQAAPTAPKPARPAPPPVSKDPKDWLARFGKIVGAKGMDAKTQADFDGLDADSAFQIYRATFPQIKNETVRRGVFRIVLAKTKDPEVIDREPARLLAVFDLGLKDPDPILRKNAIQAIAPLLLRSFATPAEWADWRRATGDKSLPQILREDCESLAAAFSTANYERKIEIYNLMARAAYQSGYAITRTDGKIIKQLKATGLNAMRRKAVAESGLFDALTLPLRGAASDELAGRSLKFVHAFRPDDAQMRRIEPALRQQMIARFSAPESQIDGSLELLFACRGDWAMPLLIKMVQNNYLTYGFRTVFAALTKANDVRALPLLIELLPATIGQDNAQIKAAIGDLLLKPEPKETLAKRDADGWRDWWAKNKADYPPDAQALTLGPLKTGADAVIVRLENNTQLYNLDSIAMQQFQALKTEERYRVLQSVWGQEMNYYAKYQLLTTFTSGEGDPDPKDPKHKPKGNPRLLDALYLGMTDADGDAQQATAQIIFQKTMQSFPDAASFLKWRKRSAGRPLSELMTEGAKSFMARLNAASEGEKADLLTKLYQGISFNSGVKIETKNGRKVRVVLAEGEIGARRKILIDGGIVTQAAALLQSNNDAASSAAANFLERFLPDDSDMPGLEAGLKRVYTRWVVQGEEQFYPSYSFMLFYKSAWVGDLLMQAMQDASAASNYRHPSPAQELMQAEDTRAIPVLISALTTQTKPQQAPTAQRLAKLTGVKYDAKQDVAFWQKWWGDNKANLPQEARAMKIAAVKSLKDALLDKLIKSKDGLDFDLYFQFERTDADTQWAVLSEGWQKFSNPQMKSFIFSTALEIQAAPNPKMKPGEADRRQVELLGLGIGDADEGIRQQASGALYNYALREIKDAAAYAAWRKEIGDKPLAEIVREETKDALTRLRTADAKTQLKLLETLQKVNWGYESYGGRVIDAPVVARGLTGVRRKMALDMNLPDILARLLRSDQTPEVNQNALTLLHYFAPGSAAFAQAEPDAARILPLLARKKTDNDYMAISMTSAYRGKWATDLLLDTAKKRYSSNDYLTCFALAHSKSARVVPTLIAIMDDQDGNSYLRYTVAQSLARLTHTAENYNHNGVWWRNWWKNNRAQMPEEARNEPIPDLQVGNRYAKTFSIKRGRQLETIAHDAHRAYWRLSSGLLISEKTKKKAAGAVASLVVTTASTKPAPTQPTGIPMADRPGLLVVLGDGDADIALQAGYWQDVAGRGFGGKYLVALVSPPKWREKQTALWLTRKNHAEVPEAMFTTESLVAEVARDMEAKYPINPSHVYLLGVGKGGPAAYACSLEPQTPFKGFLLMQSAFRSAQLPPLANAKNRRYYLLNSRDDKRTPFFAATLAQNTLRAQGATVKLLKATPDFDADQQATWQEAADGVRWLEKQ